MNNSRLVSFSVFVWCLLLAMTVWAQAQTKAPVKSITVYQDPG